MYMETRKVSSFIADNASLTHAGHGKKQKSGMGGECIVTLTGWTHQLHTNTKRKCVSILCVADARWARKENTRVGWEGSA